MSINTLPLTAHGRDLFNENHDFAQKLGYE